jgi:arylsulfatase
LVDGQGSVETTTVPQILDLYQDPQERYDTLITNFVEHTWTLLIFNQAVAELMKTYVDHPARPYSNLGQRHV